MLNQQQQPISITGDEVCQKLTQMFGREVTPLERAYVELNMYTNLVFQQILAEKQIAAQFLSSVQNYRS